MEKKLIQFIEKHQLLKKNKTVLVGVSGGPDSMALLHFFVQIKQEWNLHIHVLSVDHQLRGDVSKEDIAYVKSICEEWGLPFYTVNVDVRAYQKTKRLSTQVAARKLRYRAYEEHMNQINAHYLALGHHGDDQIETVLMSLMRTTNVSSLTGIPVKRSFATGEIVRPLLCVTKLEIEQYCKEQGIHHQIDATNEDTSYTRNDLRKHIVPKLKERNENLHTTIQLLSEALQDDEKHLMDEARKVFSEVVSDKVPSKHVVVDINRLKKHTVSLQRRVYRLTLDYLYNELPDQLTYTHEQLFLSLLSQKKGSTLFHFPRQLIVERSYNEVIFYFQDDKRKNKTFTKEIHELPAQLTLPSGHILSITYHNELPKTTDVNSFICSEEELSFPLQVRTRKDGDRISYKGLNGTKKLKDLFIDEKIPRHKRDAYYILSDQKEEILWVIGLRKKWMELKHGPFVLFEYKEECFTDKAGGS